MTSTTYGGRARRSIPDTQQGGLFHRRVMATLADAALGVGWMAAIAAVWAGLILGLGLWLPPLWLNVVVGLLVAGPVIALLAWTEGGRYSASPGKQWQGLRVQRPAGGFLGRGRALLRNVVKVGIPWALAHAAVVTLATSAAPGPDVWILLVIAVLVPVAYLATLWLGAGQTPADLVADSQVLIPSVGRRAVSSEAVPSAGYVPPARALVE